MNNNEFKEYNNDFLETNLENEIALEISNNQELEKIEKLKMIKLGKSGIFYIDSNKKLLYKLASSSEIKNDEMLKGKIVKRIDKYQNILSYPMPL